MADRFVVAAGGNWSATGTWSATDGGAGGASVPTAADNACCSNQSGNLVNDTGSAVCLDLDFTRGTGYTGTFSGSPGVTISGNIKLNAAMGMTFTGTFVMNATTGTKTITSNGKSCTAAFQFNGIGGTFQLADNLTLTTNSNGANLWRVTNGTFDPNGKKVTFATNGGNSGINTNATFFDLEFSNTSASSTFQLGGNLTVNGTLKALGGTAGAHILFASSVRGTPRTVTVNAIDAASDKVDFMDVAFAGAAAPYATGARIGDAGGNSGITFTASTTHTWANDANGQWQIAGSWTGGAHAGPPLPQDSVVINKAFTAGRTITVDQSRIGKDIDLSALTGNPTFNRTVATDFFGSYKQAASMTNSGTQAITASGRGTHTIKTNSVAWLSALTFNGPGSSYTLEDNYTATGAQGSVTLTMGTLNDGGFAFSLLNFTQNNAASTLNKTGNWDIAGTAAAWTVSAGTVNDTGGRIRLTDATATTKVFAGGGKTYWELYLSGAGTGVYQITGSNSFNTFRADPARNIQFTAGTTQNITNWAANGTAGNLNTIGSITAASHTLNFTQNPGHVDADYLSISRSTATPANWWFAGTHSTDGGNNSGWVFAVYVGMSGSANVIATVTPQLVTSILLQGADQALTNWTGSLGTAIVCRGDAQARATMAGGISTQIPLAGSLLEQVAMLGNLSKNEGEVFTVPRQTRTFRV